MQNFRRRLDLRLGRRPVKMNLHDAVFPADQIGIQKAVAPMELIGFLGVPRGGVYGLEMIHKHKTILHLVLPGVDKALLSRRLESQEILTLNVKVAGAPARDNISIEIDTVRIWTEEDYVIGGDDGNSGADPDNALSVNEARTSAGAEDVWVTGYVVGGDLSRSSMSFSPPFESATNLAIAARSSVTAKESCLSVELPSGKVRDALNLPAHPELLGRRIYLKGDIVDSYFGLTGIKNVNDFVVK